MQNKFKLLTLFMQLLYSLVIGSLSIILVIQFVFAGREFVPPIQGFINGYEWVLSILGSLSESWLQSLVAYINNRYSGVLALQSIWLPLFFFRPSVHIGFRQESLARRDAEISSS